MSAKRYRNRSEERAAVEDEEAMREVRGAPRNLNAEEMISALPKGQQGDAGLHSPEAGGASDKAPPVVPQERSGA
jgi:hypothetical protein